MKQTLFDLSLLALMVAIICLPKTILTFSLISVCVGYMIAYAYDFAKKEVGNEECN